MTRKYFERGGFLAIAPQALFEQHEILTGPLTLERPAPALAIVDIRGPLVQHLDDECDSYEAIGMRIDQALASDAPVIVLRIHSPGGLVSGCMESASAAREKLAASGKRVIAFADQACSAAYAWACAAPEIVALPSGLTGSVGVIHTRFDASEANKRMGLKVLFTTSGARKADGHVEQPLTADEQAVNQGMVDELTDQFFAHVSAARGLSVEQIRALEAGTFLGQGAVDAGLADRVDTFENLIASIVGASEEENMTVAQKALAALSALAAGTGEEATRAKAALAAFTACGAAAKKDEEPAAAKAEDEEEKDPEAEDEKEDPEAEDEKEDPEASAAAPAATTAQALAATVAKLSAKVTALQATSTAQKRAALLASRPDIGKDLRAVLANRPLKDVREILASMPKAAKAKPAATAVVPGTQASTATTGARLPPEQKLALDRAMGLTTVESKAIERTPHVLRLGVPVETSIAARKEG